MPRPTAAPEIFQLPLADLPLDILPTDAAPSMTKFMGWVEGWFMRLLPSGGESPPSLH